MYIVQDYSLAVIFCVVTMLCWGSWGNTQKLASKTWRYEFFYWDYVIGVLLLSLISGFTLGSIGTEGRSFLPDLAQANLASLGSAFLGGIIFNAANILLSAAIAICGLSVAFPVGIGLALVLGVLVNYFGAAKGEPTYIFIGVALITVAIILNGLAYKKALVGTKKVSGKGILISVVAGVIMAFFYRFVAASMDMENFASPAPGKLTPYTAVFVFAIGVFVSNFLFNTLAMKHPVEGKPVSISGYFKGDMSTHLVGVLGGVIWCIGQSFSMIASEKAGAAISYGLGQGATLVSALWGILIWKEFKGAPAISNRLNVGMFILFVIGLGFLIYASLNNVIFIYSGKNITFVLVSCLWEFNNEKRRSMKEEGDVFKKFRDSFSRMEGHFHILEQRVPVELQMEYFKYSENVRKENRPPRPLSEDECETLYNTLLTEETTDKTEKRYLLSQLATSKSVRAYRLLEEYTQHPDPEVIDWAYMALMESRISLESDFSDEKQIYISTGLGGKGEKLRFYVLMTSKGKKPFQEYQRQTIEREFAYYLPKTDCEIERLTIGEQYVELVFLIPVRTDIKATLDRVINECNQYGDFLSNVFTITNVKELTAEEVSEIINKNGDD